MKRIFQAATLLTLLAGLSGCFFMVPVSQPIYSWGDFPHQQYQALLRDGYDPNEQVRAMEAQIETARSSGQALPPGFRAHLGMLYMNRGDAAAACSMWTAEKVAFPESTVYMDSLLQKAQPAKTSGGQS